MKHPLVCSYDAPGVKTGLTLGVTSLNIETKKETLQFFFFENGNCTALIFGVKHLLVDLYQVCSYDAPLVKTDPASWATDWNIGSKKENFKILLL